MDDEEWAWLHNAGNEEEQLAQEAGPRAGGDVEEVGAGGAQRAGESDCTDDDAGGDAQAEAGARWRWRWARR